MRKLVNESEIKSRLEKVGFQSVKLSNISLENQIQIFKNAEIIVGLHGAGFTNLIFCNLVQFRKNKY